MLIYNINVKCTQQMQQVQETYDQYRMNIHNAIKWLLPFGRSINYNIKEGQKILKRSGVYPSDHMDSSGVASACNLDTRSQTFTWMGLNVCVWVYVPMHAYVTLCVRAGCMCPCVRGPWHLLMKKSSQRVLPRSQAALIPQESFSPVCHIGWWSPFSAHSLIRNMLLSLFVCLCVSGEVTQTNSALVLLALFLFPFLCCSFYTFVLLTWCQGVVLCV